MSDQTPQNAATEASINQQIREYLDLARRRKMWIILIALAISVCTGVVASRLPNVYRAETVILVDPQKVPDSYVPSTVSSSVSDRLSTMRQQVMSPTQLGRVIDDLRLFPSLRDKVSRQDLVARMQKSTTIEVVDPGGQRLGAFRIAYSGADPHQSADVANRLASMFIQTNLKVRQSQFNGTAQFLESELQETKHQLEQKEQTLQAVKNRYILDLPESKQYHLEALNNLRDQLRASQDQVSRASQSKMYLESMEGMNAPIVELDSAAGPASPYQAQIQKLDTQLKQLQERYGPNYPEVRKVRDQLNQLKAKSGSETPAVAIQDTPAVVAKKSTRNPVIEAQRNKLDQEIQDQTKRQADLQQQIQYHISKLERVPVVEQQIAGLMRDYDSLRTHYNQLQEKKLGAEMASELETHEAGERFVVLDPAVPPNRPFSPNRALIIGAGLVLGILAGIAVAIIIEMSDESVRHEREAAQIFGKPILVGIPKIITDQQHAWNRLRAAGVIAGTATAAASVGFVISKVIATF